MNSPPAPPTAPLEDSDLLRCYADTGSQEAFAELVRRRIGLVYSVALRQAGGDRHRAEDATQIVFNDLARKARALATRPVLAGWLYRSARLAAAELVRAECRRQRREQDAHTMDSLLNENARDEDWRRVRPVLDEALSKIDESDRDAIVLRFFDGRPFAEIGARLRLSENTARMRVQRALDQLNVALARRGVRSTVGALGLALANQIGVSAPAGLAASVTGAALAQSSAAAVGGWATLAGTAKLQLAVMSGVAIAGAVGYAWQTRANAALRGEVAELARQQRDVAALRSENAKLAANVAEFEALRRDDAEFKRLAQQVDEARKANEARVRLAAAQAAVRAGSQNAQAEIDRLNREGNALVNEYKALVAQGNDPTRTAEERATIMAAASRKLAEIQAKQREVRSVIAAARAADPHFTAGRTELRDPASVPGQFTFRRASPAEAAAASGVSLPNAEPVRVSVSLPNVDLATALAALEHSTGRGIIRDPSLAAVRGTIDFRAEKLTLPEVSQALSGALQKQLNVVLESNGEGALVAKLPSQ